MIRDRIVDVGSDATDSEPFAEAVTKGRAQDIKVCDPVIAVVRRRAEESAERSEGGGVPAGDLAPAAIAGFE